MQKGAQLDRFTLIRLIGTGGTSEVWEAVDPDYKKFAIKVFSPGKRLDPTILNIFKLQIEITKNLEHDNLALPITWGDHFGSPYIVLRYFKTSLMNLVAEKKAAKEKLGNPQLNLFTEQEIACLLLDTSSALEYLHSKSIKHRDIKPDNILVDRRTSNLPQFVISDFGASVDLKKTIIKESQLQIKENFGLTPDYASPEQFEGKEHIESDIFSLGISLYETCAGHLPFPQLNTAEMVRSGNPIPKLPEGYSNRLNQIINACLSLDPLQRPTASQLKEKSIFYLENGYWSGEETKPPSTNIFKIMLSLSLFMGILIAVYLLFFPKPLVILKGTNGKFGLVRGKDTIVPPVYDKILPFKTEEVITVKMGNICKWINGQGEELIIGMKCKLCYRYNTLESFNQDNKKSESCE